LFILVFAVVLSGFKIRLLTGLHAFPLGQGTSNFLLDTFIRQLNLLYLFAVSYFGHLEFCLKLVYLLLGSLSKDLLGFVERRVCGASLGQVLPLDECVWRDGRLEVRQFGGG
jgi:hypothetical protein